VGKTHKFSNYVREATKPPFVLEIDGDEHLDGVPMTIEIECPDGDTMLEVEESGSSRTNIELLCGKHADQVLELLGPAPAGAMSALVQDMMRHFGITPEQAPPGGSRASRRS
jgi:hypothetical protein